MKTTITKDKTDKFVSEYEAVFEPKDYLYFYEKMTAPKITQKQIKFLVRELGLDKPKKILDMPCGFGRHSNCLAKLGHKVTGVDLMPGFLEMAKACAKKMKVKVDYIQADMRKIHLREKFDRIVILFTSFGYYTDEENFKVMKNMSNLLKIDGLLCFDTFNRDAFLRGFLPSFVTQKGDDFMIDQNSFDSITGRLNVKRVVIRDGLRKDKPFSLRLYSPTEMKELLKRAGFKLHQIYSDWNANPFTSDSRRMIIIAKKVR
ncbi:MAG TPA: methyltransferase domain-containing protein [candidate division Zixibacteria bacterium]